MTPEEFAGRGLDPLVDELKLIQRQFEVQPRVSWAYVTGLNPLQVRLERDDFPLLGRAQTLVHESMLEIGDRVEVIVQNGRAIVQGKGGGAMPVDGRLGLITAYSQPQVMNSGYPGNRTIMGDVLRDDGFTLIRNVNDNLIAFRPPQDGWYQVGGVMMKPTTNTTVLFGLVEHPFVVSNNDNYEMPVAYTAGATYDLMRFSAPMYLEADQEYCFKTWASTAFTTAPTAGSTAYYTRMSVISIDSDAIGIPGPPGPAGPPGGQSVVSPVAFMAELSADHARSGAQSYQKVPFNNPVMNIGNAFHTGRTRFEAPVDGLYEFISQFAFLTTSAGPALQYYVNGSGPVQVFQGALAYNNPYDPTSMTEMLELSAGDYVEVYMANANSTSVTLARAYGTRFMGKLLYQYAA